MSRSYQGACSTDRYVHSAHPVVMPVHVSRLRGVPGRARACGAFDPKPAHGPKYTASRDRLRYHGRMKRTTVVLTEEQIRHLDDERQRLGVPASEIVRRALNAYFGLDGEQPRELRQEQATPDRTREGGSFQWLIGLGDSSRRTYTAKEIERFRDDEMLRYIWEDSFGGERSFDDLLATPRSDGPRDDKRHEPGPER